MLLGIEVVKGSQPRPHYAVHLQLSWYSAGEIGESPTTAVHYGTPTNHQPGRGRSRWRGAAAQGAGTGFRNRHWNTAAGRQVPIPFKGVLSFDPALMAAMQHRDSRIADLVEVVPGGMTPPEFIPS